MSVASGLSGSRSRYVTLPVTDALGVRPDATSTVALPGVDPPWHAAASTAQVAMMDNTAGTALVFIGNTRPWLQDWLYPYRRRPKQIGSRNARRPCGAGRPPKAQLPGVHL